MPSRRSLLDVPMAGVIAAVAALAGCKAPSQIILGFATDLSAPGVIDEVKMRVVDGSGATLTEHAWTLSGIRQVDYALPGSFNLYAEEGGEPTVRVELSGLRGGAEVVGRSSGLAFVSESDLFFRMTLVQACIGVDCGPGLSCIEGNCRPEAVNAVSLRGYRDGAERTVECDSGTKLIDTSSMELLPTYGDGFCGAGEWCGESTCYRNQGQGLLWCSPAGSTCRGIDGYEGCVVGKCTTELATCYGPDWHRGNFGGPCESYASCRAKCDCDPACITRCDADKPAACAACLSGSGGVDGCLATADAACQLPSCTPRATSDMSTLDGDEPDGSMGLAFVTIPAGVYYIGCDSSDPLCTTDARPAYPAQLSEFMIDPFETSVGHYDACVQAGGCAKPKIPYDPAFPDLPIRHVDWQEASTYCAWLATTQAGSFEGRLPTEAEWEAAAHGDTAGTGPGAIYPWGSDDPKPDCKLAVYDGCGLDAPVAIGEHPDVSTHFGLTDIVGNVSEWTGDWYGSETYMLFAALGMPVSNPTGATTGTQRVVRGSSFRSGNTNGELHVTSRTPADPTTTDDDLGFRCVLRAH